MAKIILIVDDEPDILMLVEIRLKASGYETLTAVNGLQALEVVKKQKPDLILLDLCLPEMEGSEVVKKIKSHKELKRIPIILFAATSAHIVETVKECGADDYCIKPFDAKKLLKKLELLLK